MIALAMPSSSPAPPFAPGVVDRDAIRRLANGDRIAFRAFVVKNEAMVFALLSRMLGRGPHVEDLAQETFLRAFRALPSFDPDGAAKPSTWLLTIATRLALDAKKKKRFPIDVAKDADVLASHATPEVDHARRELGRAIERAAASLPDDQRAALVLAEYHGLSMTEIADALQVPEATAKTRLFRAREKMREALRDWRTR